MQLSQKESMYLNELKNTEQLCVKKYQQCMAQASDPQLKTLFGELAGMEQNHYNTVDQIIKGKVPSMSSSSQSGGGSSSGSSGGNTATMSVSGSGFASGSGSQAQNGATKMQFGQQNKGYGQEMGESMGNMTGSEPSGKSSMASSSGGMDDKALCEDMLGMEKQVSSSYDTAIFESCNKQIRQTLNHIQKEEQEHGEKIFNYMNEHGMYDVK